MQVLSALAAANDREERLSLGHTEGGHADHKSKKLHFTVASEGDQRRSVCGVEDAG